MEGEDPSAYGLVLRDADHRVTSFLEKPSLSEAGAPPFWMDKDRMDGFMMLTFLSMT